MGMKSLESTFIYGHLNSSNGLTHNIAQLLTDAETLSRDNLEEAFIIITKNFKFPLKHKVIESFNNGEIILKMSNGKTKLPTCLPFILTKNNEGNIVSVINVGLYGSKHKDTDDVRIDPKKLYCMMEAAYLAKICYLNSRQLASRSIVIKHGSIIYSTMFARVFNKKYALNIDKSRYHKVIMLASKFFMINHLGMSDSDITFNYAIKNCPNGNIMALQELNDSFSTENFANLDTFITALSSIEYGLQFKDLTTRNFLEAFISMYDGSNLLSLEAFPYFVYNVLSVTNGAFINNQYVLEDIVDTHGAKIYVDLANLDK